MAERIAYRTCPICEASCGLELALDGDRVARVRGDEHDPLSRGYLCPKGASIGELHGDPDRVRTPLIRGGSGFRAASFDEAFEEIARRMLPALERHGRNALALYIGNPTAHDLSLLAYNAAVAMAARTPHIYTAGTVDQQPKQVAVACMFGMSWGIPVPDVDRTSYLLMLGANPSASNGSLVVAPDLQGRLDAICARGGRVVVVDPRRTKTASRASEWLPIRPGTDALFLFALVHVLFAEQRVALGRLAAHTNGLGEIEALARDFTPEAVAPVCRIPADAIRRIARELAAASSAAVYGRVGTCVQEFGTLASWLIEVLNVLTGNLDREGGAMWPHPLAGGDQTRGEPGRGPEFVAGRYHTRVRRAPEVLGQFPAACLAEEIDTPGRGAVRALFTMAGNPVLSAPNGERLARALPLLECMVSLDIFVNETTRHAHVILPAPSPLQQPHYDTLLYHVAVRSFGRYSAPVLPVAPGALTEWQVLLRMGALLGGQDWRSDLGKLDDAYFLARVRAEVSNPHSPIHGRDAEEIASASSAWRGPERFLDLELRTGPFGDRYGRVASGITLNTLAKEHPHGLDLGPMTPGLPGFLHTPSGKIELAHPYLVADVPRLRASLARGTSDGLLLIGRRDLRSNNSWLHNAPTLMAGRERCTLLVHPEDAAAHGLRAGAKARVRGPNGEVEAAVEISDEVARGVVCLPHGFGHDQPGVQLRVAAKRPGVNFNVLPSPDVLDVPSGTSAVNGVPVELTAIA